MEADQFSLWFERIFKYRTGLDGINGFDLEFKVPLKVGFCEFKRTTVSNGIVGLCHYCLCILSVQIPRKKRIFLAASFAASIWESAIQAVPSPALSLIMKILHLELTSPKLRLEENPESFFFFFFNSRRVGCSTTMGEQNHFNPRGHPTIQ